MGRIVYNAKTAIAVCLVAVGSLTGCSEKIDTAEEYVLQGQNFERRGQPAKAVKSYSSAIKLAPEQSTTWYDRGVIYGQLNQLEKALSDYNKAIELDAEFAVAYNNRAAIHAQREDYRAAIRDCSMAIKLDPSDSLAFRNRGLAHHDLGEFQNALADYNRAVELNDQDAEAFLNRGNVLMDLARLDEAQTDINRAITLDRKLANAWLSRATLSARLGELDRAKVELAKAKKLGAQTDDVDLATVATEAAGAVEQAILARLEGLGYESIKGSAKVRRKNVDFEVVTRVRGDDGTVTFSRKELDTFSGPQSRILAVTNQNGEVVRLVEDWRPDTGKMNPTQFALPIDDEGATATIESAPAIPGS